MESTLSKGRNEKYVKLKQIFSKISNFAQKDALHDLERLEELMMQIPKVSNELEYRGLLEKRDEIDANFENIDGKNVLSQIFGINLANEVSEKNQLSVQKIEIDEITLKEGVLAFGRTTYRGSARMNSVALSSLITNETEIKGFLPDDENIAMKKVSKNQQEIDRGVKYFFRDMSSSVIERIERSMNRDDKNSRYVDIKDVLEQITIEKED